MFGICPWREEILAGLLGSTVVGFHTQLHCNNFIESVDRFLESRIEREDASISYGGETSLVHAYPISIEWPPALLGSLTSADQSGSNTTPIRWCSQATSSTVPRSVSRPR